MRILLCTKNFDDGGVTRAFIELIKYLKKNSMEYDILVETDDGIYKKYFQDEPVQVIKFKKAIYFRLINASSHHSELTPFERILLKLNIISNKILKRNIIYRAATKNALRNKQNYDVILDFHGYGYFLTYYITHVFKDSRKYSWVHDERIHTLKYIIPELKKYNAVCCVSNSCKQNLINEYNTLTNSIVIHNIIDINDICLRADFEIEDYKTRTIVSVGRLEKQKGFEIIPKIAKKLKKKGIDFKWLIIGEGSVRDVLQYEIDDADVSEEVKLLGFKNNPLPYIKNAYIYVQPSLHEGFPTTISEAIVLKKVVVATNIPSMTEAFQGINEDLLIQRDVDKFTNQLEKLMCDKDYYNLHLNEVLSGRINDFSNEVGELIVNGETKHE